jgi:hypothetical protein
MRTENDLRRMLQAKADIRGREQLALDMGISERYVLLLLSAKGRISKKVALFLGFRPIEGMFEKVRNGNH